MAWRQSQWRNSWDALEVLKLLPYLGSDFPRSFMSGLLILFSFWYQISVASACVLGILSRTRCDLVLPSCKGTSVLIPMSLVVFLSIWIKKKKNLFLSPVSLNIKKSRDYHKRIWAWNKLPGEALPILRFLTGWSDSELSENLRKESRKYEGNEVINIYVYMQYHTLMI